MSSNLGPSIRIMTLCVIATNLLLPSPTFSQDNVVKQMTESMLVNMAGTLSIHSQPFLSEGKLIGCTLVFAALQQDWVYRKGAFIRVDGNIGVMMTKDKFGANLKVVVNEFDMSATPMKLVPSPPSRAYLISPKLQTNLESLVESYESDTPGALFSIFQMSPTLEMMFDAMIENKLTIAFNQLNGKSDVQLNLELDVADFDIKGNRKRSPKMTADFSNCLSTLANQ